MAGWKIVDTADGRESARLIEPLGLRTERVQVYADASAGLCLALGRAEKATPEPASPPLRRNPQVANVKPAPMRNAVQSTVQRARVVACGDAQRSLVACLERVGDVAAQRVRDLLGVLGIGRVAHNKAGRIGRQEACHARRAFASVLLVVLPTASIAASPAFAPQAAFDRGALPGLAPTDAVREYRPIFEACQNAGHETRLALRAMTVAGQPRKLLADPETLATALEPSEGWLCAATTDEVQDNTRFVRALRASAANALPPDRDVVRNEGLLHGTGAGAFVTGDLCPSTKPLDRDFFTLLAKTEPGAPVALSISGLWLLHHPQDFAWLQKQIRDGALRITWVNHSFHHPFDPTRGIADNFLLRPGLDLDAEVLNTERLLIAQGEVPSVFFRFPGLVANRALRARVHALHLVSVGADAWLALSPPPRPGAIVLVHPNGNEPGGLRLFARFLARGKLPRPFRMLNEAF